MSQKRQSRIEEDHGHCADVLMSDYGIPKSMRREVCQEIAKIWKWDLMFHDIIIAGVRGYMPNNNVNSLRQYLALHQMHSPKNHKKEFPNPGNEFGERNPDIGSSFQ